MLYVGCVLVVEDDDEYSNIRRTTISPVDIAASGKNLSVWLHISASVLLFYCSSGFITQLLHDADGGYYVSLLLVLNLLELFYYEVQPEITSND